MPTKTPKTAVKPSAKPKAATPKKSTTKAGEHPLEGQPAPAFSLKAQNGATLSLKDLIAEGILVLYFYPKDLTPGCTTQACSFRDNLSAVREAGATVVGVSGDTTDLHDRFIAKHELNFPLLSDTDNKAAKAYGVYKKKSLYGREFMGIERTTFIIDRDGVIRRVFPKVKVDGHTEEVLGALKELS
jgi:thioredoxin-dependent peroxiredoxin